MKVDNSTYDAAGVTSGDLSVILYWKPFRSPERCMNKYTTEVLVRVSHHKTKTSCAYWLPVQRTDCSIETNMAGRQCRGTALLALRIATRVFAIMDGALAYLVAYQSFPPLNVDDGRPRVCKYEHSL